MIYDVRHVARYAYSSVVPFSRHIARMMPTDGPRQRVIASALDISPRPVECMEISDFFGNRITSFALDQPHRRLTVELRARVEVNPPDPILAGLTPPFEEIAARGASIADLGPLSPAHHLFPSRCIPFDPEISAYARRSFLPGCPVLEGATDLMGRIHRDFAYQPGATDVQTLPADAFAMRRGVCQDFAHVMIAGLRGLGLPAAYASGYLRTDPPPGGQRLEGGDGTHAWVCVWCGPETGWIGLDPTNDIPVGEDHIRVAFGRDFADVSPIDGVIVASGGHGLTVSVDVAPVAGKAPIPA